MTMSRHARGLLWSALVIALPLGSASAVVVNVPVSSSETAAWSRSDGGTGTSGVQNSTPGVWNSTFTFSIPPGSTAISFTLNNYSVDDKGVLQLNGTTIADAVIFQPNGGAAGPGTFDFGLGGGSQAYAYVGFIPGAAFPLTDGTTTFTLVGLVNDTNSSNPSSNPLQFVNISSFGVNGTLSFDAPVTSTPTATATGSPQATATSTVTPTASGTPTITNTPTIDAAPPGAPAIPTLSTAGGALLVLVLAGIALLVLVRSRN